MAALALPFDQVVPIVRETEKQTRKVVDCSKAKLATWNGVAKTAGKTVVLRFQFANLVKKQEGLIARLIEFDFDRSSPESIRNIAECIDDLISDERELLEDVNELGTQIRVFWSTSLLKLADQVEHLDSISESLHLAGDDKSTALMALALEEFTNQESFSSARAHVVKV